MASEKDPLIGIVIRDYTLVRLLGRGAMGMVYLARHNLTDREVAIKFLSGEFAASKEIVNRFMNEAASCAALEHENIVRVYEAGQDNGIYFMIMEYVDGVELAHFLRSQERAKEVQALPWMKAAAEALRYSHSCGIVHRDLKPENIMLTREGRLKITDLGLSKNLETQDNFSMTMSGMVIGTPYYISPEQARDAKRVDTRTDIYSLGATFYHLVTGTPPFNGNSAAEVMAKHMNEPLVSAQRKNVALSDGFSDLLTKMLEKDPGKRFQTMDELLQAIERLEKGERVIEKKIQLKKADLDSSSAASLSTPRSFPLLRWFKIAGIVAALLFVAVILISNPKTDTPAKNTPPKVAKVGPAKTTPLPPNEVETPPPLTSSAEPAETSPKPPIAENKPEIEESEEMIKVQGSPSSIALPPIRGNINWVDSFGILALFVGIPLARQVGWLWGSIRAIALWIAVCAACYWFGNLAVWLKREIAVPENFAWPLAFFAASLISIFPAWIFTHRLQGHQKDTWQLKLSRTLATIPGILLSGAFAIWFMTLLAVMVPSSFPVKDSWIGSRIMHFFPAVQQASQIAKEPS